MCKAFSGIVLQSGKVLWKMGVDSHEALIRDHRLIDIQLPADFARIEISPANRNYLAPDKWIFRLDESITPEWWSPTYKQYAWDAQREWLAALDKILVRKPIVNPFDIVPPSKILKRHVKLLRRWASVWDSVWCSVWDSVSVGTSVGDSVRPSVGASVWDSVRDSVSVGTSVGNSVWKSVWESVSVWKSVWAYISSFFALPREDWKYTEKIRCKGNPFQPAIDLWNEGLVPSFDGKTWRLHGGKDAAILYEWTPEENS